MSKRDVRISMQIEDQMGHTTMSVDASWLADDGAEESDYSVVDVDSPEEGLRLAVAWLEENVLGGSDGE